MKKKVEKRVRGYADIGIHGGIFVFEMGPVASRYPKLMHIYHKKISKHLIPVTMIYKMPEVHN